MAKYQNSPKSEKAAWDGVERRVSGLADRRGAAAAKPFEEYPKMLEGGVVVNSADEEAKQPKSAPKDDK